MTASPLWLSDALVKAMHAALIGEHGGLTGATNASVLAGALAGPQQLLNYRQPAPDLFDLAAIYAHGVASSHPFSDGNKRVALMSAYVFLRINGQVLEAAEVEAVALMQDLAAGEIGEGEVAVWLRRHASPAAGSRSARRQRRR